jgi:hypothetical protein
MWCTLWGGTSHDIDTRFLMKTANQGLIINDQPKHNRPEGLRN